MITAINNNKKSNLRVKHKPLPTPIINSVWVELWDHWQQTGGLFTQRNKNNITSIDGNVVLHGVSDAEDKAVFMLDEWYATLKLLDNIPSSSSTFESSHLISSSSTQRRRLDTYAQSLIHVNRLYNKAFGVENRKVPAHVPHMIDV